MKGKNMRYLFLIVLVVAIIITAGCVQSKPATSKVITASTPAQCNFSNAVDGFDNCNGICYDSETQMCCGGTIYNAKLGDNVCCGGKLYPYQSGWDCCPNRFLKRWINDSQDNSQVWFNTSTDHCCGGKLTPGGGPTGWYGTTKQWQDCGNSCYDTGTQSCCEDFIGTENNVTIIYNVKQGKSSCCKDLPGPLPEDLKCNPNNGLITPKNQTSSSCIGGTGPYSCYEENRMYFSPYFKNY